jgi:hypothetical protein
MLVSPFAQFASCNITRFMAHTTLMTHRALRSIELLIVFTFDTNPLARRTAGKTVARH